ncbi:MAG: hypothetical protein IT223_01650 [Crocinitomicaceae bacterium]|nr:hypothetical protein [Crocinitomicaceae bacterium]
MDYIFEQSWNNTVERISTHYGEKLDYAAILFLIGVQELGKGYQNFKKDEKLELMHIAICTLLEPYGYYVFEGRDDDGWPHYRRVEDLPPLGAEDQELLIRKAIVHFFKD